MNSVAVAVIVMLILALARVHVVLSLIIGAIIGGLVGGLTLDQTMLAFQKGLAGGATIALSYALLGAFATAVASSGLPDLLADYAVAKVCKRKSITTAHLQKSIKYTIVLLIALMAIMSQNLIPVHIAFIPLVIPALIPILNDLNIDRRLIACVLTFGLVTTYMFLPVGFGAIFLNDILLANIEKSGLDISNINPMHAMAIPALGMLIGLLVAVFFTYSKPAHYKNISIAPSAATANNVISTYKITVAIVAIVVTFAVQIFMQIVQAQANSLLVGALAGLAVFMATGAIKWQEADEVFTSGMRMMALIGFIMITAQGFASVMVATSDIKPLVVATTELFAGNKAMAALAMLIVGLIVTMGIGSSFSTLPIIATIYVPVCIHLGFSPLATVAIVGTAGALGDAGSPASDSTLGPTSGLNIDGQHDHIKDSVIPTFIHFNISLLIAGWIAAMIL